MADFPVSLDNLIAFVKVLQPDAGPLENLADAMTVSARLDEGPESIETLLARAEQALALAKQRGRNRVVALSLGRSIAA